MRQIKFYLSNKAEYIFDIDIAEAILDSEDQIIKIYDINGDWTGAMIKKAHIINTKYDVDATRQLNTEIQKLPEMTKKEAKELQDKKIELLKKYRPKSIPPKK